MTAADETIERLTPERRKEIERIAMKASQLYCNDTVAGEAVVAIRDLLTELTRLTEKCEQMTAWRPIETAPKDGTIIIVRGGIAYWRECGWWTITGFDWPGRLIQWDVTHWMPLPKAPSSSTRGEAKRLDDGQAIGVVFNR